MTPPPRLLMMASVDDKGGSLDHRTDDAATGLPPQPEGELVTRDAAGRKPRGEATRKTLANSKKKAASSAKPRPPKGASGGDSTGTVEGSSFVVDIVRASARIAIDLMTLEPAVRSAVRGQLYEARREVVTGANAVARALCRLDAERLDEFLLEQGRLPRTAKELPCPELPSWGYQLIRQVSPLLGTNICNVTSKMASTRYRQERWEALVRQIRRPSHFTETLPIEIHTQGIKLRKEVIQDTTHWWLDVALRTGHNCRTSLPLRVRDKHQETILEECYAGHWKLGQPKIEQDKKRPAKWYVRLAYKRQVPRVAGGQIMAVHRGIRCAIVAVTAAGERWMYDGNDIEAYLKQIERRRRQYQYDSKAAGRSGHGRRRILRPIAPLERKAQNWRNTKNQTIARRLARWAKERGVTAYIVEDFAGIRQGAPERIGEHNYKRVQSWPYADLGMRLNSCLEEQGIVDRTEVAAHYLSQRCPRCGTTSVHNVDLRHWQHRCEACGYRRHLDVSAGENVLARGCAKREGDEERYRDLCGQGKPTPERQREKPTKSLKTTERARMMLEELAARHGMTVAAYVATLAEERHDRVFGAPNKTPPPPTKKASPANKPTKPTKKSPRQKKR